jgi:hypothetical protein
MTDQELIARVRELQKPSRIVPLSELATIAPLIASALERALDAQQWQPIETAPKDGTEVLSFNGDQGLMRWIEGADFGLWIWVDENLSDIDPSPIQPTHWMHRPNPPKQTAPTIEEHTGQSEGSFAKFVRENQPTK